MLEHFQVSAKTDGETQCRIFVEPNAKRCSITITVQRRIVLQGDETNVGRVKSMTSADWSDIHQWESLACSLAKSSLATGRLSMAIYFPEPLKSERIAALAHFNWALPGPHKPLWGVIATDGRLIHWTVSKRAARRYLLEHGASMLARLEP